MNDLNERLQQQFHSPIFGQLAHDAYDRIVDLECDLDVMRGARDTVAELKAIRETLIAAGIAEESDNES